MISLPLAMGVFFGAFVIGRIVEEKAIRRLSTEQKGQLVEAFSGTRLLMLVPIAALAAAYVAIAQLQLDPTTVLAVQGAVLLGFVVVAEFLVRRRMGTLALPSDYLRLSGIGRSVKLAGLAFMLIGLQH